MSDDGIPMLTDIGNATLKERTLQLTYTNAIFLCSPRWMVWHIILAYAIKAHSPQAPELMHNSNAYSTAGDVYALGMEILTGKVPYHNMDDRALLCAILFENNTRSPERPEGEIPTGNARGDRLWELLVQCWLYAPEKRPSAAAATEVMKIISPEDVAVT
ncbi:hypothetical protein FRC06_011592 [Ceratobasidium sp. 370]|nr:hypothetical protein FRC06_011592 [Ceratobasidium sp. 370]